MEHHDPHKNHKVKRPVDEGILILDFGSQYTLLIARKLREIGIYAEICDGIGQKPPEDFKALGLILSGGPDSVTETHSRSLPEWVIKSELPILGICYGLQLLVAHEGGKLRSGKGREYGRAFLKLKLSSMDPHSNHHVFLDMPETQTVWMSHGDDVESLGNKFEAVAYTEDGVIAAICHREKPWIALQFHPEVHHSECGTQILRQFVKNICHAKLNWTQDKLLETSLDYLRETLGQNSQVLMAVSGGVDSTVAAALLVKAIGSERVHCVFVDTGLLRKNEVAWVKEQFKHVGVNNLHVLDRQLEFFDKLKGIQDPEEKRKRIGLAFVKEFEDFAKAHRAELTHLGQGTLYPDVIESAGHGSGSKVIKSHHNVGGLPERLALKLCEPFRYLFKDEVRKLGAELGVPKILLDRHPFPGPGLAVRIIGEVTRERVEILQNADDIFIQNLIERGLYSKVWQAFAVLLPIKSVGVMGDNRSYEECIALRSVNSTDGMTANVGELDLSFLTSVADQIVRKVKGINRVVYDVTTKPPATIEWE